MIEEAEIALLARLDLERPALQRIKDEMCTILQGSGLESELHLIPEPELADFTLETDPVDQSFSLLGVWRDDHGFKRGEVQIREDGGIYAEVDIVLNHPTDKRWFIEAVTAWGNKDSIKAELRLLPAV